MGRSINGMPNSRKAAGDSGRGFSLDHQDRLDLVLFIKTQTLLNRSSRNAGAVINFQPVNLDAVGCSSATIEIAEVTVNATQYLVARRQRIDDAGLPASCAGAGEEEDLTLSGLKELFEILEHLAQKHGKLRAAVVN
jgi:hypothetical protein